MVRAVTLHRMTEEEIRGNTKVMECSGCLGVLSPQRDHTVQRPGGMTRVLEARAAGAGAKEKWDVKGGGGESTEGHWL